MLKKTQKAISYIWELIKKADAGLIDLDLRTGEDFWRAAKLASSNAEEQVAIVNALWEYYF